MVWNTTIKASDGKLIRGVSQWDINRVIRIGGLDLTDPPIIHMWNADSEEAAVLESTIDNGDVVVRIPNEFLTVSIDINIGVCVSTNNEIRTIIKLILPVSKAPKPKTYDTDIISHNHSVEKI